MQNPGLPESIGLIEILGVSSDRQHRDRARGVGLLKRAAELEPVHPRHRQIGQHHVRPQLLRLRQRLMPVVRVDDPEPAVTEVVPVHHAGAEIVLDDQHQRCFRHLPHAHYGRD